MVAASDQNQAFDYLQALDFNYIIDAMCADAYPLPRWLREDAEKCARQYKNFLWLQRKYRHLQLVPTREIDEFWHNHILYTQKYMKDCAQIFGYYLHHQPASPSEDAKQLVNNFLLTKQLYFEEFNESL